MKRSVDVRVEETGPLAGKEVAWITTEDPSGAKQTVPMEVTDITVASRKTELKAQRAQHRAALMAIADELTLLDEIEARLEAEYDGP